MTSPLITASPADLRVMSNEQLEEVKETLENRLALMSFEDPGRRDLGGLVADYEEEYYRRLDAGLL